MILNDLLEKLGVKYEQLTPDEKETYSKWLEVIESRPLTIEDIKFYVKQSKDAVASDLADCEEFVFFGPFKRVNRKHTGLKARLKNYILLEAFLDSRERAKNTLEKQLESRLR